LKIFSIARFFSFRLKCRRISGRRKLQRVKVTAHAAGFDGFSDAFLSRSQISGVLQNTPSRLRRGNAGFCKTVRSYMQTPLSACIVTEHGI
jgi:hypothetical protein